MREETTAILNRIDDAIRGHERAVTVPVPMPCQCSWCRRQGMTRALPPVPPAGRVASPAPGWWRLLRKLTAWGDWR